MISTISFAPSPSFVVELAVPKAACVGDVSPDVGPPRLIADLALTQFDLIYIKGLSAKVPTLYTQHDLTDRQGAHTRCPCTHSKAIGHYYSREARKP